MEEFPIEKSRGFLKNQAWKQVDFAATAQNLGVPPPPVEKPFDPAARRVDLPPVKGWKEAGDIKVVDAIRNRESRRRFSRKPLGLGDLSFLLWATQGIRRQVNETVALRTVPSAGARHALETRLGVLNVKDLEPGLYRYLPVEHQLLFEFKGEGLKEKMVEACLGQSFAGEAAVVFIWTAVPYRMEWRYGLVSHKLIALDAGHVCQNLYLACEAVGAGTCALAAYHQEKIDRLAGVDGKDEFAVYLAPVGLKAE